MHEKSGRKERGKRKKRKQKTGTEEAAVRQKREERKGRNRRLSSRKESGSGRKEAEAERKMQEAKAEGKHSWNSCGSEARKGERKQTGSLSTKTGKECTGNQAGENGENRGSESGNGALKKPL